MVLKYHTSQISGTKVLCKSQVLELNPDTGESTYRSDFLRGPMGPVQALTLLALLVQITNTDAAGGAGESGPLAHLRVCDPHIARAARTPERHL